MEASFRSEMDIVTSVDPNPPVGDPIRCGFYEFVVDIIEFFPVPRDYAERIDNPIIHCWYDNGNFDDPWNLPLPPYPQPWDPTDDPPGDVVTHEEVSQFAADSIDFELPTPETSPTLDQVVGIPTWLAVTSTLDYPAVSAQAGNVFATVIPTFSHVVWTMGNGDEVTCTDDVATTWDADGGDDQTSDCTYLYESNGEGEPVTVRATVFWNLSRDTNETAGVEPWITISQFADVVVNVRELQAVID
ncbi:MAG: hypothetical protein AAGA90_06530 [Actinomycetota bacterium]